MEFGRGKMDKGRGEVVWCQRRSYKAVMAKYFSGRGLSKKNGCPEDIINN